MFRRALLCLAVAILTTSCIAQEKALWTATPGYVFQQNKTYPSPLQVRLFLNSCYDKTGNVIAPLKATDNYTVAITGAGMTASTPSVGDCALTTTITIATGAQPGAQMMVVKKGSADAGFAFFDLMDATAGPTPSSPEVDVLWEVLTDHLCRDNFGNHMPRDLYCVETKVGNNSGHSLQIAGVGFLRKSPQCKGTGDPQSCSTDGISTPNVSYQTARASAQAGQSTSARNIIVNGTQALGLVMASFTPFFKSTFNSFRWSTGTSIVGTSLAQAINLVAPDQTIREINNLDDQAFRDGKLIPNNTQVRFLVFVQKRSVTEAIGQIVPEIQSANEIACNDPLPLGYKKSRVSPGKCYPEWEDRLKTCLKSLDCDPLIVKLALGQMIIIGDKIDYIQRVVVDSSVTSQEVAAPATTAPSISKLSTVHGGVGASLTITGSGFGSAQGSSTVQVGGKIASVTKWTDTEIDVTVPAGAGSGNVTVTVNGISSNAEPFTVD